LFRLVAGSAALISTTAHLDAQAFGAGLVTHTAPEAVGDQACKLRKRQQASLLGPHMDRDAIRGFSSIWRFSIGRAAGMQPGLA